MSDISGCKIPTHPTKRRSATAAARGVALATVAEVLAPILEEFFGGR
jgi:hypothetical protein